MTLKDFDKKYKDLGGAAMLKYMKDELLPQKAIAKHFFVSQERVRQWIKELFNEDYDPRHDRRENKINKMLAYYAKVGLVKFKREFKSMPYYRQVLQIINKER